MEKHPQIIGSGHAHTVSLPEGSTVATHRRAPQAGAKLPQDPPAAQRVGEEPPPLAATAARAHAALSTRVYAQSAVASRQDTTPAHEGLDDALMARLSELTRRNAAVRSTLDRLDPPGPTA